MATTFTIGTKVAVRATFKNEDAELADPTTVIYRFKNPSTAVVTAYTYGTDSNVTKEGDGIFRCEITPAVAGVWRYRIEGGGTLVATTESSFTIRASAVI